MVYLPYTYTSIGIMIMVLLDMWIRVMGDFFTHGITEIMIQFFKR